MVSVAKSYMTNHLLIYYGSKEKRAPLQGHTCTLLQVEGLTFYHYIIQLHKKQSPISK